MADHSKSYEKLDQSTDEVYFLIELHEEHTGTDCGKRSAEYEILNKSAVVLVSACWEAFCEDLCAEALDVMITSTSDPTKLPKDLRKHVSNKLQKIANQEDKHDKDELAIWRLADGGWKQVVRDHLKGVVEVRNRGFSNPKSDAVDNLFEVSIGLKSLSSHWGYNKYSSDSVRKRLDAGVELRSAIAHRNSGMSTVKKEHGIKFGELVVRLAGMTDAVVNAHVKKHAGVGLF